MSFKITGSISKLNNPLYPPKIGTLIVAEHPEHINDLFIGSVYQYISDNSCILILLNNNDYIELYG